MAFAESNGKLQTIERAVAQAPYALRISDSLTQDYDAIYKAQPAVRMVIDFLARNVAQLGLHTFSRLSDTDRMRLTDHPFPRLMTKPNSRTTTFRLFRAAMSDRGIYDTAFWLKTRENNVPALVRLPPKKVRVGGENWMNPEYFEVKGSRGTLQLDPANVVYFRGYNPIDDRIGLSPIESLRRILAEEYAAGTMREQVLRNGARVSGYIERPATAPKWGTPERLKFRDGWRAQYTGATAEAAGGTPVLEDGMTFKTASQTATDLQYVEARKLTREEVAAAYFIPPPMVGILDHATFGNIQEQHKMLYADTLGPWLEEFQQEIELQLLPDFPDIDHVYVEFNLAEKLRGSFEEQAAQLQSSVGAPYLTRNEARARANLPRIEGGDSLIVPLNVLEGGQVVSGGSPAGAASAGLRIPSKTQRAIAPAVKARAAATYVAKASQVLEKFFARQEASVRSALGSKADTSWWNEDRWNEELSAELYAVNALVTVAVAKKQLDTMGEDPEAYDLDRTLAYLAAVARSSASSINAATKYQLETALDAEEAMDEVGNVFAVAKGSRAQQAALTIITGLSGFATLEAVTQVRGTRPATKTWLVTSSNPRSSHAAMSGESVPIDQPFSNGAKWPGDSTALDVDELAGCSCDLLVSFE